MSDAQAVVVEAIEKLLKQRDDARPVTLESKLVDDLELSSLELAELSAVLEDTFDDDPYSQGLVPDTVGDIIGFYGQ